MAKAAARDYKTRRKKAAGFSGWMGVLCGLAFGLAVAGIVSTAVLPWMPRR